MIREVLQAELPPEGLRVLEVASGSGEHAAFFAAAMPGRRWIPSDPDPAHRDSISAWIAHEGLNNVDPPLALDVEAPVWPITEVDAIFCANMVHIAPWSAAVGLFEGAARLLPPGGRLLTYGPYQVDGNHTSPSNADFDASLRARDARWGVRDIAALAAVTSKLRLLRRVSMPANNLVLVWERQP